MLAIVKDFSCATTKINSQLNMCNTSKIFLEILGCVASWNITAVFILDIRHVYFALRMPLCHEGPINVCLKP